MTPPPVCNDREAIGRIRGQTGGGVRISLVSLGCARTLVDSEVALGGLEKQGYEIVRDVEKADVAVVNTCGFIEEAKRESVETILRLCEMKKEGRLEAVVVLGCLAQRYGVELWNEIGELDAILGTDSYGDLARLLEPLKEKKKKVFEVRAKPRYLLNEDTPRYFLTPAHYAYVKISEGCINACSYCVIPKMKGPHRSRPIESVLNEVKKITRTRPLSEINLVGQDTAAYGYDRNKTFQLPSLLKELGGLGAVPWIRLLYAHPGHVSDELIGVMADTPSICRYVDYPIEHSHDAVLERMNRGVTRSRMLWGIEAFRKKIPSVTLRTTVIVGFPGETEEEFKDLMDFLKEVRFERLGAFQFSEEEGARAFGMPDPVPPKAKEERFNAVMSQQREIAGAIHENYIGKTLRVLVDEKDPSGPDLFLGRTEGDAPEVDGQVMIHSKSELAPGDFVDVRVTDAWDYDLIGTC